MSDIVERLLEPEPSPFDIPDGALPMRRARARREAAAEIERLRTEAQVVTDEWVAARDEIRRLRTVNAALLEALELAKQELAHFGLRTFAADVVNDAIALAKVKP